MRSKRASQVALGCALCVSLARVLEATAQPARRPLPSVLEVAAGRCIDGSDLAASIEGWLDRDTVDGDVTIRVEEMLEGVRYQVRRAGADAGSRTLPMGKSSCADVRAAVALAIAIALDASVLDSLGIAPAAPAPAAERAEATPAAGAGVAPGPSHAAIERDRAAPPSLPPSRAARRQRLAVAVEGAVLASVLPSTALAVAPAVDVSPSSFVDVRLGALVSSAASAQVAGGDANLSLLAGRAEGCAVVRPRAARARACVAGLVGAVTAEGAGFTPSLSSTSAWVAAALRVDATWMPTDVFGMTLAVEGVLPLVRPRLDVLRADGAVAESLDLPVAGLMVGLGPTIVLW